MSEENNKQPLIENNGESTSFHPSFCINPIDAQEQTTETGTNDIKESIVVETPDQASNPSSPSVCLPAVSYDAVMTQIHRSANAS